MFHILQPSQPDALVALMRECAGDTRANKLDLGVGVYRNAQGATPVMAVVKDAEAQLLHSQLSKSYLGPEGDSVFCSLLAELVFKMELGSKLRAMQTPGGTGAVRLAIELAKQMGVERVWCGTPTWPNHKPICNAVGIEFRPFAHGGANSVGTMLDELRAAAVNMAAGEAIILHGCCHNPTGFDYSNAEWNEVAQILSQRGILPIIDLAYQGMGRGLEADAAAVRSLAASLPNVLVAYGCDKNFGLYRDRVGALFIKCRSDVLAANAISQCCAIARSCWSMPPDHGAAVVRIILADKTLRSRWFAELNSMRDRVQSVRRAMAEFGRIGAVDLEPFGRGLGLFGMLELSPEQIQRLRRNYAIYVGNSGRVNVAGLNQQSVERLAWALLEVQQLA